MNTKERMASIDPVKLSLKSRFSFKCHPQVSCFTLCCKEINIILTPYDIIRLKNRLGLTSDRFLALYTTPQILQDTNLPVVTLRLLDEKEQACPFVRKEGCIVYEDRPTTCRYYPLGSGLLSHKEDAGSDDFYFFINEPHCRGFEEETEWTVGRWRTDQGVDVYDEINSEWMDLIVRKRSFPKTIQLTDESKKMFFLASYNIDHFRRFVFESSFLKRYAVSEEEVERIREDEIALLKFGIRWLRGLFFKVGEMERKDPV